MMVELKRIMVAVDYSDCSREAFRVAAELAEHLGASVNLVHVWSAPFFGPEYEDLPVGEDRKSLFSLVRERASEEMDEFLRTASTPPSVSVTSRVESGEPVRRILQVAEEERPDVIVVGTHGRTGPTRWLLGSVAERLVQLAECPVLTVPLRNHEE